MFKIGFSTTINFVLMIIFSINNFTNGKYLFNINLELVNLVHNNYFKQKVKKLIIQNFTKI